MTPAELESLVAREVAKLPRPRAPKSLVPRVLAAAGHRRRESWHRRGWRAWPATLKFATAVLCAGFGWLAPYAWDSMEFALAHEVVVTAGTLWRVLVQPVAVYLAALGAAMVVASAVGLAALTFMLRDGGPKHEAF